VTVLQGIILDNDTGGLDVGRLEVSEQTMLIAGSGGNTIVSNQGLGENENLSTVGWIGHGLWVSDEGRGENSFTRDVGFGAEGLAGEDRAVLEVVSNVG
jgi:hypothetical protein